MVQVTVWSNKIPSASSHSDVQYIKSMDHISLCDEADGILLDHTVTCTILLEFLNIYIQFVQIILPNKQIHLLSAGTSRKAAITLSENRDRTKRTTIYVIKLFRSCRMTYCSKVTTEWQQSYQTIGRHNINIAERKCLEIFKVSLN